MKVAYKIGRFYGYALRLAIGIPMSRLTMDVGKRFPEITGAASDAFASELAQVGGPGNDFKELILDFEGTSIISSMAMGTIFATYQKLTSQGKNLVIVNASERVKRLLRMVNMAHLLALDITPKTPGE